MGKKDPNGLKRKRLEEDILNNEEDPELEAEMAAVLAMRAENEIVDNNDGKALKIKGGNKKNMERNTYNKEGILRALEGMGTRTLPFIETLEICEYDIAIEDENDDLAREMEFYNQSLLAVKDGRDRLEKLGVPTKRPLDYFCENIKSDAHMTRVKDKLILEEKKIDSFEQRKKRENDRKFNKQVSDLKKQDTNKDKKDFNKEISKFKKGGRESGSTENVDKVLKEFATNTKSFKRQGMDKKYGSGIKDRMKGKMNDKKSLNDLSDYNPRGGKMVRRDAGGRGGGGRGGRGGGGRGGGRGGGGRGDSRPGKSSRDSSRSSRQGK